MRHIFEIGSNILCFEPDERKEKLIYNARIISHEGHFSERRKLVPLYLVHFLGWNKKWDRIVSQDLLLPLNDFNNNLKAKIDEIAREEKRNALRHDLIDEVLEIASKVIDDDRFDWSTVDEKLKKFRSNLMRHERSDVFNGSNAVIKDQNFEGQSSDNFDTISDGEKSLFSKENEMTHLTFCPKINLTDNQMTVLELDYKYSSMVTNLIMESISDIERLTHGPCVVDILQMYLEVAPHCHYKLPGWKDFERFCDVDIDTADVADTSTCSFLDSCLDNTTRRTIKLPQWPDSELNANYQRADISTQLCFEICSGIRVLFDFYIRSCLLYETEWHLYDNMVEICNINKNSAKLKPITTDCSLKLVPDQFKHHRFGFQPSLFYGYSHLLRLLYEMPRILVKMCLTKSSLTVVLRHCFCFIKYLDANYKDFNPGTEHKLEVSKPSPVRINRKKSVYISQPLTVNSPRRSLRSDDTKPPSKEGIVIKRLPSTRTHPRL